MTTMTDTLILRGPGKFDLTLQRPPTATAEGETLVLNLPVFAAGFPESTAQVEILLAIDEAEQLAAQLHAALKMARARGQSGG
jgi:hypothetical protein